MATTEIAAVEIATAEIAAAGRAADCPATAVDGRQAIQVLTIASAIFAVLIAIAAVYALMRLNDRSYPAHAATQTVSIPAMQPH